MSDKKKREQEWWDAAKRGSKIAKRRALIQGGKK